MDRRHPGVGYALITIMPLLWIVMTGFKSPADAISYPPKVVFEPTLEGYVNLFTTRTRQTAEFLEANPPPKPGTRSSCANTTW
jgi:multiple sugar transport system permease protein